jgi:hypothetical protein
VDNSRIIAHLSGTERRTVLSLLDHLLQARGKAIKALLALAYDFVADDVLAWRRSARPAPPQLATRLESLKEALATAQAEALLVARTLADRCPIPETWAYLQKECEYLLRGQREKLYQADAWEREVIQGIKTDHARVVAEMEELRRQLRGTAPRGDPGRPQKYPKTLALAVSLRRTRKTWTEVWKECKQKSQQEGEPLPRMESFVRRVQAFIKADQE